MAKKKPKKQAPPPAPQIVQEAYVVAAFDRAAPRFLCHEPKGRYWAVTGELGKAARFGGVSLAHEALDAHMEFASAGHPYVPGGAWRVWRVTLKASFEEA